MTSKRIGTSGQMRSNRSAEPQNSREAAFQERFSQKYGIDVGLNSKQRDTLSFLLTERERPQEDRQARAEAFLAINSFMAEQGQGAHRQNPEIFEKLIAGGEILWGAGTDQQKLANLQAYAGEVVALLRSGTSIKIGVQRLHQWAEQKVATPGDAYEGVAAMPVETSAVTQQGAERRGITHVSAPIGANDEGILESVYGHRTPQLKITSEMARRTGLPMAELPNGNPFTYPSAARFAVKKIQKGGIDRYEAVIELFRGMHYVDRNAVFTEMGKLLASDGEFSTAPSGEAAPGQVSPAYAKVSRWARKEMDGIGQIASSRALRFKAITRPTNESGQLQAHDVLMLNLNDESILALTENAPTVLRILENSSTEQLRAIDAGLRRDYGVKKNGRPLAALDKRLEELDGLFMSKEEGRRARFLVHAPRVDGVIPEMAWLAYETEESTRDELWKRGTDETRHLRAMSNLTGSQVLQVAGYWHQLNEAIWHHDVEGGDGSSGDPFETSMYAMLRAEYQDLPARTVMDKTMANAQIDALDLAMQGLVDDPNDHRPPHVQRQLIARFGARLIPFATGEDLVTFASFIRADDDFSPEHAWMPTRAEWKAEYQAMASVETNNGGRRFPGVLEHMEIDVRQRVADDVQRTRINEVLKGHSFSGPEAMAVLVRDALDSGFLGINGTRSRVLFDILNRPNDPNRLEFINELCAAYEKLYGKDLREVLLDKFGESIKLPNGDRYPSRMARLLDQGMLSDLDSVIYALHEDDAVIGKIAKLESDMLLQTAYSLDGASKIILHDGYEQATGDKLDGVLAEIADSHWTTVDWQRRNVRRAAHVLQVTPYDVDDAAFVLAGMIDPDAPPQMRTAVEKMYLQPRGISGRDEWLLKTFGDAEAQAAGVERLQGQLAAAEGDSWDLRASNFAASKSVDFVTFARSTEELGDDVKGNGIKELLNRVWGPEVDSVIEHLGMVKSAAVQARLIEAQIEQMLADPNADPNALSAKWGEYDQAIEYLRQRHADGLIEVSQLDTVSEMRIETLSNIFTTAALVVSGVAAPGAGALVMMVIGAGAKALPYVATGSGGLTSGIQVVRGAVSGAMVNSSVTTLSALHPDESLVLGTMVAASEGAKARYGLTMVEGMTDPRTFHYTGGVQELNDQALDEAATGAMQAGAVYIASWALRNALKKDDTDGSRADDDGVDEVDGGGIDDSIDDGVGDGRGGGDTGGPASGVDDGATSPPPAGGGAGRAGGEAGSPAGQTDPGAGATPQPTPIESGGGGGANGAGRGGASGASGQTNQLDAADDLVPSTGAPHGNAGGGSAAGGAASGAGRAGARGAGGPAAQANANVVADDVALSSSRPGGGGAGGTRTGSAARGGATRPLAGAAQSDAATISSPAQGGNQPSLSGSLRSSSSPAPVPTSSAGNANELSVGGSAVRGGGSGGTPAAPPTGSTGNAASTTRGGGTTRTNGPVNRDTTNVSTDAASRGGGAADGRTGGGGPRPGGGSGVRPDTGTSNGGNPNTGITPPVTGTPPMNTGTMPNLRYLTPGSQWRQWTTDVGRATSGAAPVAIRRTVPPMPHTPVDALGGLGPREALNAYGALLDAEGYDPKAPDSAIQQTANQQFAKIANEASAMDTAPAQRLAFLNGVQQHVMGLEAKRELAAAAPEPAAVKAAAAVEPAVVKPAAVEQAAAVKSAAVDPATVKAAAVEQGAPGSAVKQAAAPSEVPFLLRKPVVAQPAAPALPDYMLRPSVAQQAPQAQPTTEADLAALQDEFKKHRVVIIKGRLSDTEMAPAISGAVGSIEQMGQGDARRVTIQALANMLKPKLLSQINDGEQTAAALVIQNLTDTPVGVEVAGKIITGIFPAVEGHNLDDFVCALAVPRSAEMTNRDGFDVAIDAFDKGVTGLLHRAVDDWVDEGTREEELKDYLASKL